MSFNFTAAVTVCSDFGVQENKVCHCFHFFPICHAVMGLDAIILVFFMLSFKPAFSLSSFTFIKRHGQFSNAKPRSIHVFSCTAGIFFSHKFDCGKVMTLCVVGVPKPT